MVMFSSVTGVEGGGGGRRWRRPWCEEEGETRRWVVRVEGERGMGGEEDDARRGSK